MYAQFTSCAYGVFKGAELSVSSKSSSSKKKPSSLKNQLEIVKQVLDLNTKMENRKRCLFYTDNKIIN